MFVIALLTFLIFFYIAYRRPVLALWAAAALLPTYLLRFKIFGLPSTMLEVIIWAVFFGWIVQIIRFYKAPSYGTDPSVIPDSSVIPGHSVIPAKPALNYDRRAGIRNNPLDLLFSRAKKISIPLAFFFLASILAILVSPDLLAALGVWRAYFLESVLFFLILLAVARTAQDFEKIIFGLSLGALFLSLTAFGQKFFGLPIPPPWQSERRVTSVFPYPNALGLYLAPIIFLAVGQLKNKLANLSKFVIPTCGVGITNLKFKIKNLLDIGYWFLVIGLSLASIFFAKSDGAIIAVIMGLIALGLLWNKKIAILTLLVFLFSCFLVFLLNNHLFLAIKDKLLFRDWSGSVRLAMWRETWEMLKHNWLFGAGLAGYQIKILPYHTSREWMEVFLYPHNFILNFWSELGLFGLLSFLWLIEKFGKLCYALWQSDKLWAGVGLSAMLAILVHGLVDAPYFKNDLSVLFWIIYSIAIIQPKIADFRSQIFDFDHS